MPRTLISSLSAIADNTPVEVSGWVETVRDQKRVQFVILRDETGVVQLVNPATREIDPEDSGSEKKFTLTETISGLTQGSFLTVTGALHHDERVSLSGLEVKISGLEVASLAYPGPPSQTIPALISAWIGDSLTYVVQKH